MSCIVRMLSLSATSGVNGSSVLAHNAAVQRPRAALSSAQQAHNEMARLLRTRRRITVRCNCLLAGWHNALPRRREIPGNVVERINVYLVPLVGETYRERMPEE